MKIVFWPDITDRVLEASVKGDVLTINGEKFDFSPIKEGFQLPGTATNSYWFHHNPITRINGELTVTVKLPVFADSPDEIRNPAVPLYVNVADGLVPLPDVNPTPTEEEIDYGSEPTSTNSDT